MFFGQTVTKILSFAIQTQLPAFVLQNSVLVEGMQAVSIFPMTLGL